MQKLVAKNFKVHSTVSPEQRRKGRDFLNLKCYRVCLKSHFTCMCFHIVLVIYKRAKITFSIWKHLENNDCVPLSHPC